LFQKVDNSVIDYTIGSIILLEIIIIIFIIIKIIINNNNKNNNNNNINENILDIFAV
jgi:hypothetical protein